MPDPASLGTPSGSQESLRSVQETVARAQALVDTPRADDPLRWYVEAQLLGDLPALAISALRASRAASPTR